MCKKILGVVFLVTSYWLLVTFAYAQEQITITTYYPSPYGSYRELRAQRMAIGNTYINNSIVCWGGAAAGCPGGSVDPGAATSVVVEGNVGIGTASPGDKLTVAGNAVPSADNSYTCGKSGQRWSAVWAANGTIQTCFLDQKNVTNWEPFSDYLSLVPRPIQFAWKSGSDNNEHLGYVGDDLPEIAKVLPDGIEDKAVVAILCGAIKQLETKVKELETKLAKLNAGQ